uniref:Uncharacterized protein n=1 Tax=Ananas comosus var. bracteatus TaxID=296719 RepID=A0A6V7QQH5_ANACO
MEEVEEATRAAVERSHRVLNLLSQSQDQLLPYRNLRAETEEAVSRFRRVASLLGNDGVVGHARVRRLKNPLPSFNHKLFSESPYHPDQSLLPCLSSFSLEIVSRTR